MLVLLPAGINQSGEKEGTKQKSICKAGTESTILEVIKEQSERRKKRKGTTLAR